MVCLQSRTEEELDIALGMATGDQDKSAWVQKFMGRKRAEPGARIPDPNAGAKRMQTHFRDGAVRPSPCFAELFTAEVQAKCKEVIFSMP
eukprot:SAG31_NODE_3584_length_4100_cov_1.957761_4_plen_90_part_00